MFCKNFFDIFLFKYKYVLKMYIVLDTFIKSTANTIIIVHFFAEVWGIVGM